MASIIWEGDNIVASSKALGPRLNRGISGIMLANTSRVEGYARIHAPWTDRTGNARQGLFAKYSKVDEGHQIELFHSVPYGIWLEVKNSGQFAILGPTVRAEGPRIMKEIAGLISRLGGEL